MEGCKQRTILMQHSRTPLEIKGHWNISGPQVIGNGEGQCPEAIAKLFDQDPDIEYIAIARGEDGIVYGRPGPIPTYTDPITYGYVMTIEEFLDGVRSGLFSDYDGNGHPVKDNLLNPRISVYASRTNDIPADATHVVWYNK